MKIIFDELATEKIKSFGAVDLALDFTHTLSETNTEVDACAGGISRWRLVAVDKGTTPGTFDGKMESEFGSIYFQDWGKFFWDEHDLKVGHEGSFNLMTLKTDWDTISNNFLIVDFRGKSNVDNKLVQNENLEIFK
ncbi:iron-sulfur cluster biosynthesis family protein [Lactococcus lactis]